MMDKVAVFTNDTPIKFFGNTLFSKIVVILVSGKAGTGKSTFASILFSKIAEKRVNPLLTHFAAKVKDTARMYFKWNEKKDDKGRELLQCIGGIGRKYNPTLWAEWVEDEIWNGYFPAGIVIVDDWRFPNEAEYFESKDEYQVFTVKIIAPEREILKGTDRYDDISETSLDNYTDFDCLIYNSGDMYDLERSADAFVDTLFRKE